MYFLAVLALTALLSFLLHNPLKRFPWMFYVLAVLVCALSLWLYSLPAAERPAMPGFYLLMRRGYLALSLFTVVMFIGVLNEGSVVRQALQPVRAELSIIAAILILGHLIPYLIGYLQLSVNPAPLRGTVAFSLFASLIVLTLLAVLTITSFNFIKKRMKPRTWKRLQCLAYVFFALVYVHLAGFLLPSALSGSPITLMSITVYSALFASYLLLRLRKWPHAHRTLGQKGMCKLS
jgi:DMSO/TMAO reductase YedYZ heme-binding membrane subunit